MMAGADVTSITVGAVLLEFSSFLTFAFDPPHETATKVTEQITSAKSTYEKFLGNRILYSLTLLSALIPLRRMSVKAFAALAFEIFNKRRFGSQRLMFNE